jgi:hypothetical protein
MDMMKARDGEHRQDYGMIASSYSRRKVKKRVIKGSTRTNENMEWRRKAGVQNER